MTRRVETGQMCRLLTRQRTALIKPDASWREWIHNELALNRLPWNIRVERKDDGTYLVVFDATAAIQCVPVETAVILCRNKFYPRWQFNSEGTIQWYIDTNKGKQVPANAGINLRRSDSTECRSQTALEFKYTTSVRNGKEQQAKETKNHGVVLTAIAFESWRDQTKYKRAIPLDSNKQQQVGPRKKISSSPGYSKTMREDDPNLSSFSRDHGVWGRRIPNLNRNLVTNVDSDNEKQLTTKNGTTTASRRFSKYGTHHSRTSPSRRYYEGLRENGWLSEYYDRWFQETLTRLHLP